MYDFYTDLEEKGKPAEEIVEAWLKKQKNRGAISSYKKTEHTEYEGLDYETDFQYVQNNRTKYLEVKSIAGITEAKLKDGTIEKTVWTTFCIEPWADDNKTKRPGWYRTAQYCEDNNLEAMIVFYNRLNKTLYFHDSVKLRKLVEFNGCLTYSKSSNKDERGWIVLYGWEYKPTFIGKVKIP